jgi:ring-1,2-phenylacetyl-CoA epoxidase subunit PaaC
MNDLLAHALAEKLLALADDELILGHRQAEWTGHAPILEEDIAFANIAQDELGHAIIWYELRQELTGEAPDRLAFFRAAEEFRNTQFVELPKGDWAFSMVRQYLFDAAEAVWLEHLADSAYAPLAAAAAKMRPEELYHLRHTAAWIKRLGLGTAESGQRTQTALATLWPYATQLFAPLPHEAIMVAARITPEPTAVASQWQAQVIPFLTNAGLTIPTSSLTSTPGRDQHTPFLAELLADMQMVARSDPEAEW